MRQVTRFALTAVLATAAATDLVAQQTWIVDQARGPGYHFTEIRNAVSAAVPGDLILVRPGFYRQLSTGKPLRIIAEPGASIRETSDLSIEIEGVPPGSYLQVSGFDIPFGNPNSISIRNCGGTVHLDSVNATGRTHLYNAQVSLTRCTLSAVHVESAELVLDNSQTRAYWGFLAYSFPPLTVRQGRAIVAGGSHLGRGLVAGLGPEPAIVIDDDGVVVLAGGVSTEVRAGASATASLPAIDLISGSLVHDPDVTLVPTGSAPAVAVTTGSVTTTEIPTYWSTCLPDRSRRAWSSLPAARRSWSRASLACRH